MRLDPLTFSCPHVASAAEQGRDPEYLSCGAAAGEPCRWARRYDGEVDPGFHAERIEVSVPAEAQPEGGLHRAEAGDRAGFEAAVLRTGLV